MHLLLDTHALIWWMTENPSLPESVRRLIREKRNTVVVSAASAWEMAIKVRLGRLPAASDITRNFEEYLMQSGFESLPVSAAHGIRAGFLPGPQRDPFDRMLIAQAQAEDLTIVSNELSFDNYGVRRAW
ncbi:MAG: type II toxin-antitoxin system VapC family toxin [Terriglobales bacterium]